MGEVAESRGSTSSDRLSSTNTTPSEATGGSYTPDTVPNMSCSRLKPLPSTIEEPISTVLSNGC